MYQKNEKSMQACTLKLACWLDQNTALSELDGLGGTLF